jgi:hypothetical protein
MIPTIIQKENPNGRGSNKADDFTKSGWPQKENFSSRAFARFDRTAIGELCRENR